jgi:hypothetical protein
MFNIKPLIQDIYSEIPSRDSVYRLIHIFHKLAKSYLQIKYLNGHIDHNNFGININDLAIDSIAELFKKNDRGEFIEIKNYFNKYIPVTNYSEEEILIAARRLVFSSVNHTLYRLYKAHDSSLSKIIRNIKNSVKNNSIGIVERHHGELVIVSSLNRNIKEPLPQMPPELLSIEFYDRVLPNYTIPSMVNTLCEILNEQENYQKSFSVIETAKLIRNIFSSDITTISHDQLEEILLKHDINILISKTLKQVDAFIKISYVDKLKVTTEFKSAYLKSIEEIFINEFSYGRNGNGNYFNILEKYIYGLDRQIYKNEHKNIFEYLVKIAKRKMKSLLTKEFLQTPFNATM